MLRYSSLSDNSYSNSNESPGQRNERPWRDGEIMIWDREQVEFHRKLPDEHKLGPFEVISDGGKRGKIGEEEKNRLQIENNWLRNRLSAANSKLRELKKLEDKTSGDSCDGSISSNRSSKMRCSVLGRKKNKSRENHPSDASTVVMGTKSKSAFINGKAIKDNSVRAPKKTSDTIWNRYLSRKRRDLSPRLSVSQTPDRTPPCTPERSTPVRSVHERFPRKDDWSSINNGNRNLISPLSSNILGQDLQESAHIHQSQLLGIEACLYKTRNETRRGRENMFMSFSTAVRSEVFTVEDLKPPNASKYSSRTRPILRKNERTLHEI